MNREQIIAILKILKTAYPKFYAEMSKEEMHNTIDLWTEMFAHESPSIVIAAVKNLINSFKFPPTIADIKEEMHKLTNERKESPIEMWNIIMKAIQKSAYYSHEEYEKLPQIAQKFVGSPRQLREWALSEGFNEGVEKSLFLKQYEVLVKKEKEDKMMLPEARELLQQIKGAVAKDINLLEG
jgi:hypothetical protein